MRHFHYIKGWAAERVSSLYSEALNNEDEPVSHRWIELMEQKNRVPVDEKRRWILATLLNIPPTYFGLKELKSVIPLQEEMKLILPIRTEPVDITAYQVRLKSFWMAPYNGNLMDEVAGHIYNLQEEFVYERRDDQIAYLLCSYLFLFANLCRYRGYYNSAIIYLTRTIAIAKERVYYEIHAKALYLRGYTFFDKWDVYQRNTNETDLIRAMDDFAAAQEVIKIAQQQKVLISQPLRGALISAQGLSHSYYAYDVQDRSNALQMVDRGGEIVNTDAFQLDEYFFRVNKEIYHIDKAEALLSLGQPQSALKELAYLHNGDSRARLRFVYRDILEAEAYIAGEYIEMGVAYAEHALAIAQSAMPIKHLARILHMYKSLQNSRKYANNPEVARLGVKLLKIQHPEIFA